MVSIPDRAEVLAYFTGEKDATDSIDEELRTSTLIEKIAEETKNAAREALERPLCTKESILQTPNTSYKYLLAYCKDNLKHNKKMKSLHKMLIHVINTLEMCDYKMIGNSVMTSLQI